MDVSSVNTQKIEQSSIKIQIEKPSKPIAKSSEKSLDVNEKQPVSVLAKRVSPSSMSRSSGILKLAESEANSKQKIKSEVAQEVISKGEVVSEEAWDSASKRFDQQDPSKSITRGVRVEDIIEPTADYQYVSGKRANPFVPSLVLGRPKIVQKELSPNDVEIPIISPLQSFSAKQLSVIGVWEGGDGIWKALIQTPTNQGIETKLGDPAGNSGGRIMSITLDAVIVREFSIRTDGTREYRDIPLYMGSDRVANSTDEIPGGRLILKPGASAPIVESPNAPSQGGTIINAPKLVPSNVEGTLTTVVPFDGSQSEAKDAAGRNAEAQMRPQVTGGGVDPVTGLQLAPQAALSPNPVGAAPLVPGQGAVGTQPASVSGAQPASPTPGVAPAPVSPVPVGQTGGTATGISSDGIRTPISVDPFSVKQPSVQGGSL